MSFNLACNSIIEELEEEDKIYHYYASIPICSIITNENSITHKNNKEFMYK